MLSTKHKTYTMKKVLSIFIISIVLTTLSCSKQTIKQDVQSPITTNTNIKSGSTGITLADASTLAIKYLQSKNFNTTITLKNAQTIIKNGVPYFHVINANAGFVILSADSMYMPLLAYDSASNFSLAAESINPGLINWFNKHGQELDFVRNNKSAYVDTIAKNNKILWKAMDAITSAGLNTQITNTSRANPSNADVLPPEVISATPVTDYTISNIGPLCRIFWGQDYPFNFYCPTVTNGLSGYGNHAPAGCVPVAMAQIAYFWKYPTTYNWASMPLNKTAALFSPVTDASKLISDIGVRLGTVYSASSGGSDESKVAGAFLGMGYKSATNTASLTTQAWSGANNGGTFSGLINNEIQTYKRPLIVSGFPVYTSVFGLGILPSPGADGHAWVCDGSNMTTISYGTQYVYHQGGQIVTSTVYSSIQSMSLLHMNWGWYDDVNGVTAANNGWYNCSGNYTQANSSSSNYQYFQIITYNIHT